MYFFLILFSLPIIHILFITQEPLLISNVHSGCILKPFFAVQSPSLHHCAHDRGEAQRQMASPWKTIIQFQYPGLGLRFQAYLVIGRLSTDQSQALRSHLYSWGPYPYGQDSISSPLPSSLLAPWEKTLEFSVLLLSSFSFFIVASKSIFFWL